jgi:predicted ATPase
MVSGGVRSVRLEGFASIRHAEVELHDLNVLVGANGAGKSNFIRALELLGRIADGDLQFFVGVNGFSALAHRPSPGDIILTVDGGKVGYRATLVAAHDDGAVFAEEEVRGDASWYRIGRGTARTGLRRRFSTPSPDAIAGVVDLLSGCRVFHFHDTSVNSPAKRKVSTADNLALHSDAGNIAAYLLRLSTDGSPAFEQILDTVRQVAPFFRDFVLQPDRSENLLLRWRQTGLSSDTVFSANQMSDGTLRFICLATLLLSPELPKLVVLDEPELGLHPYAIVHLAEMLRLASLRSQVVVATQSVTLMNQFEMPDLVVVERRDGASIFGRPDSRKLQEWLEEYSLGELWEKNMIGGRPGPELSA